jgi:branched-chain amino acid transport system substrate-binding protein
MLLVPWCSRRLVPMFVLTALLALAVAASACGGGEGEEPAAVEPIQRSPETPIVIPPGDPIIIGISAALTGPAAALDGDARDAAIVGIVRWKRENGDQIGGHDIQVHAEDDSCIYPDVAAMAAGHLLRGEGGHQQLPGLVGVIGPTCSGGAEAVIPDYAAAGIVMISGSATRTDLTLNQPRPPFFFRTAFRNSDEGELQARYAVSALGAETAYVVDDDESYGIDLANAAQRGLQLSGRSATRERIEEGQLDFSDLAERIAADGPDVVIFEGFNPEAALLYRQMRDAGYDGPFLAGDGVVSVADFIEPLGDLAEGTVFAGCSLDLPEEFLADYEEIIGHAPTTSFVGHYADAATILLDALAQVAVEQEDGSLRVDPLELREAVSTPQLLAGLSGAIAFDDNGDRIGSGASVGLAMCRVEGGRFVNFEF